MSGYWLAFVQPYPPPPLPPKEKREGGWVGTATRRLDIYRMRLSQGP